MADRSGFTLVEAAVAIAVVAILAGATAPMAVKLLDQRRATATRRSLRLAFEAMFGRRDQRIGNMRADFGFSPPPGVLDLGCLVSRRGTAWRNVPDFGLRLPAEYRWGYNGPYWLGDTRNGAPVDAWGSPIEAVVADGRVQLVSRGRLRSREHPEDDLRYPDSPAPLGSFDAQVLVVITQGERKRSGRVVMTFGGNASPTPDQATKEFWPGPSQTLLFMVPAGTAQVEIRSDLLVKSATPMETKREHPLLTDLRSRPSIGSGPGSTLRERVITMDLLPGETREVRVNL
jgi:prepilin-type N-terminal cleavage/methylation domain-containing protein